MQTRTLDLEEQVIEELAFDPRVTSDDIAVSVKEGIVTLRGSVPNFYQKWEVENVVKQVRGVRGIADELVVDLPTIHVRNDTDIALSIKHRFESNALIPSDVTFIVQDGSVTLSGEVSWYYQLQEAAYEARRVTGVRNVANLIMVKSLTWPDPDEIKNKIHASLQRTAAAEDKSINVAVSLGQVTLSGSTRSWVERDNAAQAAWSVPGVMHVDNFISVNSW
jgi:osmotically-inducible protein OsmY